MNRTKDIELDFSHKNIFKNGEKRDKFKITKLTFQSTPSFLAFKSTFRSLKKLYIAKISDIFCISRSEFNQKKLVQHLLKVSAVESAG